MKYYSVKEFEKDIRVLAKKIEKKVGSKKYIAVYAVPRGGYPIAIALRRWFSFELITELDYEFRDRILIVDDLVDSGATRKKYEGYDFAVLHIKEHTPKDSLPTYYIRKENR